ncbi:hypothetical protein GTP58_20105 [Duganella sp. CY15W]|uniref:hypothetical protein n=1 Tax=Duganella sp. CY15W TaxID=2692172 RepID=UPI00136B7914|nr:hypothetical protein [Duganella sp. CY15W]MYM30640.1 hypothetical protein [Duganella sp. CY15W]
MSKQSVEVVSLKSTQADLKHSCIFTGVPVSKTNGEHVIPNWMRTAYDLHHLPVEMGETLQFAKVKEFRAPAESKANNDFGKVEDKVRNQGASLDELHLWSKKIAVGMLWNHWRLSANERHPNAPSPFDERHLRFALQNFQEEFKLWRENRYVRTGSTVILPRDIEGISLAHAFGATVNEGYSMTHDAIQPFGYMAISYKKSLIVSSFYDDKTLEEGGIRGQWEESGLKAEKEIARIRAGLSTIFAEHATKAISEFAEQEVAFDDLFKLIAYQLGIVVLDDKRSYRLRTPEDA